MKRLLVLLFLINIYFAFAVQITPEDFVPGLRELTESDWEFLHGIQKLSPDNSQLYRELPSSVDNSLQPWLRPVYNQDGGSCGQASGIGYCFTYEINRLRELPSDIAANQYADHYTWNFLNGGIGNGSWYFDGWQIVKAGGCPTVEEYGGMFAYGQTGWMNGYDSYRSAMENRVDEIFEIDVSTESGLIMLKNWFYDHGADEDSGGLVCFSAGVSDLDAGIIPQTSPCAGEFIIHDWTLPMNHAMTFVGYDDSVHYDYNGDGEITNDVDINNDGEITMADWERGALKMVNSWGQNWANNGYCWVMYRTLAALPEEGGIWTNAVHGIWAKEEYEPLLTLQAQISHSQRYTISLGAGVSREETALEPEIEIDFPHFNYQGGAWNLPGNELPGEQPLEIGLDVTPLLSEIDPDAYMQWWLTIESQDADNTGTGTLDEYSFIDETGQEVQVFTGTQSGWGIINNWVNHFNVAGEIDFEPIEIISSEAPDLFEGVPFEVQLEAEGGHLPLNWDLKRVYNESTDNDCFPQVEWQAIDVSDNDDGMAQIELPFNFYFYNELYQVVTFITDGSLVLGNGFSYIRNEDNLKAQKCITAYGTDLMAYPEDGDGYYYYAGDDYILFRWCASRFGDQDFDADFVIALNQYSNIRFYYDQEAMSSSTDWVSGVSRGDNVSYEISSNSGNLQLIADEVIKFEPQPFPQGQVDINDEGVFYGEFTSVHDMYNPYQFTFRVTDSYGIYDQKTLGIWIATLDEDQNESVPQVTLQQNYPNPFMVKDNRMQGTVISFQLAKTEDVRLDVYNIKGQKVHSLVNESLPEGKHQAVWDGLTDSGSRAAAGVYFYKLTAGSREMSRKLLLLR